MSKLKQHSLHSRTGIEGTQTSPPEPERQPVALATSLTRCANINPVSLETELDTRVVRLATSRGLSGSGPTKTGLGEANGPGSTAPGGDDFGGGGGAVAADFAGAEGGLDEHAAVAGLVVVAAGVPHDRRGLVPVRQ